MTLSATAFVWFLVLGHTFSLWVDYKASSTDEPSDRTSRTMSVMINTAVVVWGLSILLPV